jgi:amino acid adenylation domain-containing protein
VLYRLGERDHALQITLHHIACDGASLGVLVRELGALYPALAAGRPAQLPALELQYADYARWQRAALDAPAAADELAYWREALDGAVAVTLALDRPRARGPRTGARCGFELQPALCDELRRAARARGVTPFVVLLAGFQVAMSRHAGQRDVTIGTATANRLSAQLEPLIGFFVNTLAIRSAIDPALAFDDVVAQVQDRVAGAFAHAATPFDRVAERLGRVGDGAPPLVLVVFSLQESPLAEPAIGDLALSPWPIDAGTAQFDLSVDLVHDRGRIAGSIEYDAGLFDAATIAGFVARYLALLASLLRAPGRAVANAAMLSAAEHAALIQRGVGAVRDLAPDRTLHGLFEAQVDRSPDAIALHASGATLTYRALDDRASRLAGQLAARGVGPEALVAVCMAPSFELIAALLAVLKAGAAYVPLDPKQPASRVAAIRRDCNARLLVLDRDSHPDLAGPDVLRLHPGADVGAAAARLRRRVLGDHLAYVIYTSGSTGTPKGVMVAHASVANLLDASIALYGGPGARVLLTSSIGFDTSVEEIFTPLVSGGTLHLAPRDALLPGPALVRRLRDERITTINFTASVLAVLAADELPALHTVVTGGERLTEDLVARWQPGRRLINVYGQTETTIEATSGDCIADGREPSLGETLPNYRLYVLDEALRPVPVGVAGEAFVAGVGVARGYLGRPELTAAQFVPDPFSSVPGARMYRSGDRLRRAHDGRLLFVGRVDEQVKLRGLRIEPGEVEAALRAAAGVSEAVVVAADDRGLAERGAATRLLAYVTPRPGAVVSPAELRAHTAARLPDFMVPSSFVVLDAFPLTTNGKVDRRALPVPASDGDGDTAYVAPRDPIEHAIAEIWCELLGRRVGVDDDFFASGGHSLLATQAVSRIRDVLGVELPLRELFETPTIAALAGRCGELLGLRLPAPVAGDPQAAPVLSFGQERLWLAEQLEPGTWTYNMAAAIHLRGALDVAALTAALAEVVRRHQVLRTAIAASGATPTVRVCPPAAPITVEDLRELPAARRDAELRRVARARATQPLDLASGALLRCHLIRTAADAATLVVVMHHIASDGWSVGVLVEEVRRLYRAAVRGEAFDLPALGLQYADFARWQRAWLSGPELGRQLAYWQAALAGAPHRLALPLDRPRQARPPRAAGAIEVRIPAEVAGALPALARREAVTPFMILLAAYQAVLARYSGERDIVVATQVAGRRHTQLEALIGFFVNQLPIRTRWDGDPSFAELVRCVRETCLGAFAHQDVPFDKLVEAMRPARELGLPPLAQVGFGMLPSLDVDIDLAGVTAAFEPLDRGVKLDLMLELSGDAAGFAGALFYDPAVFDRETASDLVEHFGVLLAAALADPATRISGLPLLSPEARDRARAAAGAGAAPTTVVDRFVAHARKTPDAIACTQRGVAVSYGELGDRACRLAAILSRAGVGPESRVAVLVERSPRAITAILGVLHAGAAYVPIDPQTPAHRVALLIADSGAAAVIATPELSGAVPPGTRVISPDAWQDEPPAPRAPVPCRPEHLAYVIYTSGSTGAPKGVAVEHGQLASYVTAIAEKLDLAQPRSFGLVSTLAADLGHTVMFSALTSGGALHVISEPATRDAHALAAELAAAPVDVLKIVPTHLAALLDSSVAAAILPRHRLVLGGEAAPWSLIERVRALAPGLAILNHYGPTETTVGVATHDHDGAHPAATLPIGRALRGARLHVLGPNLELVPAGLVGELYIGGAGVARGYLGAPDRTAERFVPDPFSEQAGARMYRTGDRVRRHRDGALEFLGRTDQQVKIHGNRVEPGEVAAAIRSFPAVRDAVVVARAAHPGGELQLVAYVAAAADALGALDAHLRSSLPPYLVPAAYVALPSLPYTANGKIDAAQLPEPVRRKLAREHAAPRTAIESRLARIWSDLLDAPRIGRDDDFFALGGHSLLAIRALSRIRDELGVELGVEAFFRHRTLADQARAVEARIGGDVAVPPVVALPRTGRLPLAPAQERLWFLEQLEPDTPQYNVAGSVRLRGPLDADLLEDVLRQLVQRHEALRTVFHHDRGEPYQVVIDDPGFVLARRDLSDLPAAEARAACDTLLERAGRAPFRLDTGPLVRAVLVRLGPAEHALGVAMHHIVSDGWSLALLIRELAARYRATRAGQPAAPPPLAVQYVDYAGWQRAALGTARLQQQLDYWTAQLAGAPPALALPLDRPRSDRPSTRGSSLPVSVPAPLVARLDALARQEGATLFMAVLAVFTSLLARVTGERDIAIGTPIAGRDDPAVDDLVGFFVNTLVLRTRLDGRPSFREALRRARDTALAAFAHRDVPFARVVEALRPERQLGRIPLFQAFLVVDRGDPGELAMGDVVLTRDAVRDSGTAPFELCLDLDLIGGELVGRLEYRDDLFDAATIARLAAQLATLLAAALDAPDAPLGRLALQPAADRARLLHEWNATGCAFAGAGWVHERIAARARACPDAVACALGDRALSYAELDDRARRLAAALRDLGVGPESRVALLLDRSPELLVAILGVLRAGGGYVPLDVTHPADRLRFMVADSGAQVVVTTSALADRVAGVAARTVAIDAWSAIAAHPPAGDVALAGANLAYVIYTSGSTGRPKGAINTHEALLNRLLWHVEQFGFGPDDRVIQKTPYSFDVSVWELLAPLLVGARVVFAPPGAHDDARQIAELITGAGITVAHFVPSMLRLFLDQPAAARCTALRCVIASGEALPGPLVDTFHDRLGAALHNLYGPTEAAIDVTWWPCPRRSADRRIAIGRPIANVAIRILDDELEPVPVGVAGELYIGGVALARGYAGRPDLTAERFVPDPHARIAGARLYRTGDRARYLAGGDIEYLGRLDFQVKIRGVRIELEEIEARLGDLDGVAGCAVVVQRNAAGDPVLVGFAVPRAGAAVSGAELRRQLGGALPAAMVPGAIAVVDALPVNASGKVDRRALAERRLAPEVGAHVAPSGPTEVALAAIWQALLGAERVGAADDFFALGGHSLLATQLISRIHDGFGVDLPVRAIFEAPTLAELAARIDAGRSAPAPAPALELVPGAVAPGAAAPLTFSQERIWFIEQLVRGTAVFHLTAGFRIRGALDRTVLQRSLDATIARHDALRSSFHATEAGPEQRVAAHAPVAVEPIDLAELAGDLDAAPAAIEARLRAIAEAPFELTRAPLVRVAVLALAPDDQVLSVTAHHLIADGWSIGIFVREVIASYDAFRRGAAPDLPAPPIQYGDYARWQRGRATAVAMSAQLAYWRDHLAGAPPVLELPASRLRPPVQRFIGSELGIRFAGASSEAVTALARRCGATTFMAMLAGFAAVLGRHAGQDDVVIGISVANRRMTATEGVIGCFINVLPVRVRLAGRPTFAQLVARVREAVLAAFDHQDVPFERLVAELQPPRDLSRSPIFQVMFDLKNFAMPELRLDGAAIEAIEVDRGHCKYDLTLGVVESASGFTGHWEYSTDVFDAAAIGQMAGHLDALLASAAADAECEVVALGMTTPAEAAQLAAWTGGREQFAGRCLHHRFEDRARLAPDAIAVVCGDARVTYAELDDRASRWAHQLQARGVAAGQLVALHVERSIATVVGILAILKAGAGYVPIDPNYPPERVRFLLADCGARIVVADAHLIPNLAGFTGAALDIAELDQAPGGAPVRAGGPDDIAYVIYTSGSTGVPKGSMVSHASASRLFDATARWFRFDDRDVWTLFHSYGFDFSVWEIWGALVHGGRLVVVPLAVARAPAEFYDLLCREQVTVLNQTPSAFQPLIDADAAAGPLQDLALRHVIFGGEALELASLRRWFDRHDDDAPRLVNMYGITETTVHVTYRPIRARDVRRATTVIGVPIPDLELHVLDARRARAPIGVAGEIYVGGAGVALGYLGRPDLTAERFVPDPFSGRPGARLYRSGDLARYQPDGELEYLGRLDSQVKLRGYRVELGEIEAVLARLPGVRTSAVVVREDAPGDQRLIGYVVGPAEDRARILGELRAQLPAYMVPVLVFVDALPTTSNGKLDRAALPMPGSDAPADETADEPATEIEAIVAGVFAELLGVERVRGRDNFFELGGHSLLATQLAIRFKRLFSVDVPLRTFYEYPTVAEISLMIEQLVVEQILATPEAPAGAGANDEPE